MSREAPGAGVQTARLRGRKPHCSLHGAPRRRLAGGGGQGQGNASTAREDPGGPGATDARRGPEGPACLGGAWAAAADSSFAFRDGDDDDDDDDDVRVCVFV